MLTARSGPFSSKGSGAFLVRRPDAFHANVRERLVKRPKVYRRDRGLLHALGR